MAESKEGEIYWHSPDPRAIIPLYEIRTPKTIRQLLKRNIFHFTYNSAFERVIKACADREDTWISEEIIESYISLHKLGYAQSVEAWMDGRLAGGLYGVSIAKAFFGESMFSLEKNSSKAAFYMLVEKLRNEKYILLDTQYINLHTKNLGAIEIPKKIYLETLKKALASPPHFVY